MTNEPTLTIVSGISNKTQKEYKALMLKIGDWSSLYFPQSQFEMTYIVKYAEENNIQIVPIAEINKR